MALLLCIQVGLVVFRICPQTNQRDIKMQLNMIDNENKTRHFATLQRDFVTRGHCDIGYIYFMTSYFLQGEHSK